MRFSLAIFCLLLVLLLTGVIPIGNGQNARAVYYSPVFILLLALLSGASVWCCLCRRFSLKQGGFYLVHLGIAAILCGAFIGYVTGAKGTVRLPLRPGTSAGKVVTVKGRTVEFGFTVAAEDFEVKFYPPVYQLYRPLAPENIQPGQMPFEAVEEFSTEDAEIWKIGEREFTVSGLRENGEWREQFRFEDGSVLFLQPRTPAFYGVTLVVKGDGLEKKLPVRINHPADYNGWRFYLVSYSQRGPETVQLSARRDPGRPAVIAGIWAVIAGTFLLCFRKGGGAHEAD